MTAVRPLDTVVLTHDLADVGLCAGDIGAIVQLYSTAAVEVEFVSASGRTQALLTLRADCGPFAMTICSLFALRGLRVRHSNACSRCGRDVMPCARIARGACRSKVRARSKPQRRTCPLGFFVVVSLPNAVYKLNPARTYT